MFCNYKWYNQYITRKTQYLELTKADNELAKTTAKVAEKNICLCQMTMKSMWISMWKLGISRQLVSHVS